MSGSKGKTARGDQGVGVVFVDSIDDRLARVMFEGQSVAIPRRWLPRGTREGDALRVRFEKDEAATRAMRENVSRRLDRLRDEGDDNEVL